MGTSGSMDSSSMERRDIDYGFRFYSPHSGRWLSKDPIGEFGGANIYRFARNGPMNCKLLGIDSAI